MDFELESKFACFDVRTLNSKWREFLSKIHSKFNFAFFIGKKICKITIDENSESQAICYSLCPLNAFLVICLSIHLTIFIQNQTKLLNKLYANFLWNTSSDVIMSVQYANFVWSGICMRYILTFIATHLC